METIVVILCKLQQSVVGLKGSVTKRDRVGEIWHRSIVNLDMYKSQQQLRHELS